VRVESGPPHHRAVHDESSLGRSVGGLCRQPRSPSRADKADRCPPLKTTLRRVWLGQKNSPRDPAPHSTVKPLASPCLPSTCPLEHTDRLSDRLHRVLRRAERREVPRAPAAVRSPQQRFAPAMWPAGFRGPTGCQARGRLGRRGECPNCTEAPPTAFALHSPEATC
jgi:hypothetical protein